MSFDAPVPVRVSALRALDRVDYQDAFAMPTSIERTPEQWSRLILEGAEPAVRAFICALHRLLLRFRLASASSREHVLGWTILESGPEHVVLGVESSLLTPRIIITTRPGQLVFVSQLRFERRTARAVWAVVAPLHRAIGRSVLDHAARLAATGR